MCAPARVWYPATVAANNADALEVLRSQTPERLWKFAVHLAGDPAFSLTAAAAHVGAAGQGEALVSDARTCRALAALKASDRDILANTRGRAIGMLAALCSYDPADAFDKEWGQLVSIHEMPVDVRAAITSYEKRMDGTVKIRFAPRLDALKVLLAHFADLPEGEVVVTASAKVVFRGRGAE